MVSKCLVCYRGENRMVHVLWTEGSEEVKAVRGELMWEAWLPPRVMVMRGPELLLLGPYLGSWS